ncbi:MAG TPA: hypothetical protein VNZ27_06040 [Rhodanobacter sp.]|jgi:hypothetical protein|nr:hypothetical protein [Rhodanobacter sp.]
MNSIWKNLLSLHGHITHADLAWRPDTRTEADQHKVATKKAKSIALMCCVSAWPRLVGPR